MAMSFGGGSGGGGGGGGGAQTTQGNDLEQIDTEQLNFHSISGDDKLRLLPSPWPTEHLPPSHASLLSIASTKGLVAAAGPDTLVVAKTETVRTTFREGKAEGEEKIKTFTPEATLPIPRVSQVAFASDESCLVIAAEQGGGLAVYDTSAITSGSKDAAFQIGTNGVSVRQLLPNPNPSAETAHLFGIVLETGQLLLANLKTRELTKSSRGDVIFHANFASACWSRLGKQIVAGRADGTAVQIDQKGEAKAEIPVPPKLPELTPSGARQMPLMSIYWLDTNEFLLVHTPPSSADSSDSAMDSDAPVDSVFHLARRENAKSQAWTFQTIIDPAPPLPFGGRLPPHYFVQRLKDWPPHLDDLLLLISTASTDVGMLSKASSALGEGAPTAVFTTTNPPDTNRAGMPMAANGMDDTFALGMALDLSVNETISKPIPRDAELAESPVPLPALYVLNHEGVLRVWYIGYNDSIRQKVAFPDLLAAGGPRPLDAKQSSSAAPTTSSAPAFGTPSAPSPSSFGGASRPTTSSGPAFGAPSTPSFGGSSAIGQKQSLWGAPPASTTPQSSATKAPTFGSSTPIGGGNGFGQVGGMGQKASPWASGGGAAPTATFGQPSGIFGGNAAPQSPFAGAAASTNNSYDAAKPSGSLFGGGKPMNSFGGLGSHNTENKSPFAAFSSQQKTPGMPAQSSFASTASLNTSSFGGASTVGGPSLFGTPTPSSSSTGTFGKPSLLVSREESMQGGEQKPAAAPSGLFGTGAFKLNSTFQGDGSAKDDLPRPQNPGAGLFGSTFGNALGDVGGKKAGEQPVTPIKAEPGTEKETRLQDIPAVGQGNTPAGLPAKKDDDPLTYKAKRFAGDLPPMDVPGGASEEKKDDPLSYKAKRFAGDVPPTDAPGGQEEVIPDEKPVAGSPPIDLGNERFSEEEVPAGPADDDEEDWSEEEDGDENDDDVDDDEEGEDEDDDESDHEVTDPKGLSAFESRMQPASPTRPDQAEESTTPATEKKAVPSFTPAGLPKGPVFAPPVHESPRSPSPVRSVTAPLVQKATFGQQTKPPMPSLFSRPSTGAQPQQQQPAQAPQSRKEQASQQQMPPQRIAVPAAKLAERSSSPAATARGAEPIIGALEDEEDARIQAILASAPEPTKDVPAFLAHQDYVGSSSQAGDLSSSIEKLFRDVNSMIDTLGLNAHWLRGFVEGHVALKADGRRTEENLEDEEAWTLDEISALTHVQDDVDGMLDAGGVQNVSGLVENISEMDQDIRSLKSKAAEMRVRIKKLTDPQQKAADAHAALSEETQALQMELRGGVQGVQTLLGQAEEAMSLLRAELASSSSGAEQSKAVPTVEAITNTILKMTAMIERKSGDVDLLESRIRRLPGGIAALKLDEDYEDQLVSSLAGSRLLNGGNSSATPPQSSSMSRNKTAQRSRMLDNGDQPGMSAMFGSGRFLPPQHQQRTPPSGSLRNSRAMFSPEASRLGMSTGSVQNSAVKKPMGDVSQQEVELWRGKVGRRRGVGEALRKEVQARNGIQGRVIRLQS